MRRRAAGLALLVAASARLADGGGYSAAVNYALECQGCHRAQGEGTPGTVPALAGAVARFLRVPGGREYLVRVPGVSQAPLDDAALAAVLDWVLRRFDPAHLPPDYRPYTAEEVGRLRRRPLTDLAGERARLVGAMDAKGVRYEWVDTTRAERAARPRGARHGRYGVEPGGPRLLPTTADRLRP